MSILSDQPSQPQIPAVELTWAVARGKPSYAIGVGAGRVVEVRSDTNFNRLLRTLPYSVYLATNAGLETLYAVESTRRRPHRTEQAPKGARRVTFPPGTSKATADLLTPLAQAVLPYADDDGVTYL